MKLYSRVKSRLKEDGSLSSKLLAKRLFVGAVRSVVRLAARAVNFSDRVLELAKTHGLDIHEAWNVKVRPDRTQTVREAWSARDFLFVMDTVSGKKPVRRLSDQSIRTSIIIPVFDKVEYTFQCLRSLMREVDLNETEVIVVDNASRDETRQMLSYLGDFVRVIENEESMSFVDACNQGAGAARGEYLVFLNNDTVVRPGWLKRLVETIESDPSVGAVGSMFLDPHGLIQEAGAIIWRTGEAFHYGWGKSPEDRRYNFAREVDYCSGASLLVRKELFDRLGGFDRRYVPAHYEDADLCFGVRSLGYKVVYQPMSRLVRYESITAGTDTQTGYKQFQTINREKFYEKWREVLAAEHFANDPALVERAADRRRGPSVVVFDDRIPTPDRDAGSARMMFILKALAQWSRPVFVSFSKQLWPEYEKLLWQEGIETVSGVNYRRLLKSRRFNVAILSRPEVAGALLPSLRRFAPGTKIVYDMVDAHFIRFEREYRVTGDEKMAREARRFRNLETRLARASDLIWCTSPEEKMLMEREAPGVRARIIPTIHRLHDRGKTFEERRHLLFVGSFRHRPNSDGVLFFMREVFPLIRQTLPEAELYIVGDNPPPEIVAYGSERVHVLGYVPDVDPLFQSCRVFVAPLRFGAGVKGKIGEALSYGIPVVTTSTGAEGMGLRHGEEVLIADAPHEFAECVVRSYRERELWQRLTDNGRDHIRKNFTPQVIGEIINGSIKESG